MKIVPSKLKKIIGFLGIPVTVFFLFIIGFIVVIAFFASAVSGAIGSTQSSTASNISLTGSDPNVQMVKPNAVYASEFLRVTRKYVFNAYKNGEETLYAPLDKTVARMKEKEINFEDAYLEVANELKSSATIRPFQMPINMKEAKNITGYWSQERGAEYHTGWDISAPAQTAVYAPADGGKVVTVNFPSKDNNGMWNGNTQTCYKKNNEIHILYNFNGREYLVVFAHLYPDSALVKVGDTVQAGQKIAGVGTTGCSTGNHLHIELRLDSNYLNTTDFFLYADLNTTFS